MCFVFFQFDFLCCVVSYNGFIYIIDCNNCCLLVFDIVGEFFWELIEFGSIGLLVIVVNKRGNIVVMDLQIIKVFSLDGVLLYNFFFVYSKKDVRFEIFVLVLD